MDEGRYVYCVIEEARRRSFGAIGIGGRGEEVYTIPYKGISAVVSRTPLREYEPDEANALAHERVVETVMEQYTVLPMKFCTIFRGEENVRKTLANLHTAFKSELKKLEGKVEVGVKVLWEPRAALEEVERSSPEIRRLKKRLEGKSRGVAYLLKTRLDSALKEELNRVAERLSKQVYELLRRHAEEARLSSPIGHMILNASFLVPRNSVEGFKGAVEKVDRRYQGRGLEFVLSGPWPPYNFISIRYK